MTKTELISTVAEMTGAKKAEAAGNVDAVIMAIATALAGGEKVQLPGLGTFEVKATKPRMGRNPKTGEAIEIPAGRKVSFKAGKELKGRL